MASVEKGFSLVELLVAMTLGLLLTSGMISVFASNRESSELNAAIANMQENARYALDAMSSDIRNAGFLGCLGIQSGGTNVVANVAPTSDYLASAATGSIIGASDVWAPAPPLTFVAANHDAVPGTHALSLQFGDADTRQLSEQMKSASSPSPSGTIKMKSALDDAEVGDLAIISNCDVADIFAITGIANDSKDLSHEASASANAIGNLSAAYGDDRSIKQTQVMLFRSNVYYVGYTGQQNESGDEILALYQQSLPYGDPDENPPTELVAGIENLRVSFGIRQSGGNLRYVPAYSSEYDSSRVESIQIGLLMASRERIADQDDAKIYTLAGQLVPPSTRTDLLDAAAPTPQIGSTHAVDRRFRLAFNTTVKIRNRRYNR